MPCSFMASGPKTIHSRTKGKVGCASFCAQISHVSPVGVFFTS